MITLPSGRQIGEGRPPFIIAEVGSNWLTLEDCLTSISQAKLCGADAVKFQAYNPQALYGAPLDGSWTFAPIRLDGQLPLEWLPKLAEKAKAVGIEFMCSAFSPELVDAVDPYVNIHKVASAEMTHVRILEKLRQIGKPVILSAGASGVEDIRAALSTLGPIPVVLMYCVAAYPAREVNLGSIQLLKTQFDRPVGYSDHSVDVGEVPFSAVERGACVLEKHVTFVNAITPDSPHSLGGDQFKRMVRRIRDGNYPRLGPTPEERPMILRHNRRLIATRDIPVGDTLQEGINFGIYRSLKDDTKALSPFMIDYASGRAAKNAIMAGDGIGPGDL
jgi:sialic acid synthase SpsE